MSATVSIRLYLVGAVALLAALSGNHGFSQSQQPAPAKQEAKTSLPAWATVETLAKKHFSALPDYKSGDILVKTQVAPLFDQLTKAGWKVADQGAILKLVCNDGDFVATHLRSKEGRSFMRKIAGKPEAYDKLHRLAETEGGDRAVRDMMKLKNGDEVLLALTDSKAGRDISRRLGNEPRTSNFDKPTGMLYTEAQILARLKASYSGQPAVATPAPPTVRKSRSGY